MKKTIVTLAMASALSMAADLYTGAYLTQMGIVAPHVDTGIANRVDTNALLRKRVQAALNLYFSGDTLNESSQKALEALLQRIEAEGIGNGAIAVIGHSASFRSYNDNVGLNGWSGFWQSLSEPSADENEVVEKVNVRIKSVYDMLRNAGIPAGRIYTENRLDKDPLATEATGEGRALNERVEILFLK